MNEKIIANWNSQVSAGDIVYHLGDFSFGTEDETIDVLTRLNGSKHFIMGNHDAVLRRPRVRALLADLKDYKEIKLRDTKICLFHFPMHEWHQCHRGSFHLFGHVHETYQTVRGKSLNVGLDSRPEGDMLLWTEQEIFDFMASKPTIAHH
jgi:calcineurin-like phosphoesterase family protein